MRRIRKPADQALDRLNTGISQLANLLRDDAYQIPWQLEKLHKWTHPARCPSNSRLQESKSGQSCYPRRNH